MHNKFSIEDLIIRILPGGFVLSIIFFYLQKDIPLHLVDNLDFLYTFIFFCSAFIIGELLQTLAHELEGIINVFFKFKKPSHIFLYKGNPVLNNQYIREDLLKYLNLSNNKADLFNKEYSDIKLFYRTKKKNTVSQDIFWKLYYKIRETPEMRETNRNYLFARVISTTFLLTTIFLLFNENLRATAISGLLFLLFIWRTRGIARGLVFQTVLLNIKK